MSIIRKVMLGSFVAATLLASPIYAGVDVNIGFGVPLFYAEPNYRYEQGEYRIYDGHYYRYDAHRRGWYYDRKHDEGMHRGEGHRKEHHHDNGRRD